MLYSNTWNELTFDDYDNCSLHSGHNHFTLHPTLADTGKQSIHWTLILIIHDMNVHVIV